MKRLIRDEIELLLKDMYASKVRATVLCEAQGLSMWYTVGRTILHIVCTSALQKFYCEVVLHISVKVMNERMKEMKKFFTLKIRIFLTLKLCKSYIDITQ